MLEEPVLLFGASAYKSAPKGHSGAGGDPLTLCLFDWMTMEDLF
jgi:hypothetical protein